MMRRALALLLLVTLATTVQAQHRDCNLAAHRYDNPFSDHAGWTMRRYQWHAFYAALSTVSAEGLHRVTGWPRWLTASIATVGIGIIPHIRGSIEGKYPFDLPDWAFDAFNRASPLLIWTGVSGGTWQSKTLALTTEIGGYASLACFASP